MLLVPTENLVIFLNLKFHLYSSTKKTTKLLKKKLEGDKARCVFFILYQKRALKPVSDLLHNRTKECEIKKNTFQREREFN